MTGRVGPRDVAGAVGVLLRRAVLVARCRWSRVDRITRTAPGDIALSLAWEAIRRCPYACLVCPLDPK